MEDQQYFLKQQSSKTKQPAQQNSQLPQQSSQSVQQQQQHISNNQTQGKTSYSTAASIMNNYQPGSSHAMSHLPFHPQSHQAYLSASNASMIDYSVPNQSSSAGYHQVNSQHYPPTLHNGYHNSGDPYLPQTYPPGFDYDYQNSINPLTYYGASIDQSSAGNAVSSNLSAQQAYGSYPSTLSTQHYPSNLPLDPNSTQGSFGQFHNHHVSHPSGFPSGGNSLDPSNYLQFGSASSYPGVQGHNYLQFNTGVPPLHNGSLHPHPSYGLLQNPNQIGLLDPQLTGRSQQIGKSNIKSEDQAIENELNLVNSLGDSQSQAEEKSKQNISQFAVPPSNDQQQSYPPYYALSGYNYSSTQQGGSQKLIPSLNKHGSTSSLKERDSKRQPNSPGKRKNIKKKSLTSEPSSPASPKGRKRKNQGKSGEILGENSSGISPILALHSSISQPQASSQIHQFNLNLMKVQSQPDPFDQKKQLGHLSTSFGQVGSSNVMLEQSMQSVIHSNSLQRLKELPVEFNMSDFATLNDEPKQIGPISKEERRQKIKHYQEKRKKRSWTKKISYDVRKKVADSRLRDKGRFVTKKQAMKMLSLYGKEEDFTMEQLKEMLKQRGLQNIEEEDSKSPPLQPEFHKNFSQPGTRISLKQGDDQEEGYNQQIHSEGQLPDLRMISLQKGNTCEDLMGGIQQNISLDQQSLKITQQHKLAYFEKIQEQFNQMNNSNSNKSNSMNCDSSLLLKLEQKEIDNNTNPLKTSQTFQQQGGQQIQFGQSGSQTFNSSSPTHSQSPLRSPKKQNTNTNPLKLIEITPSQLTQQSSGMTTSLNNQLEGSKNGDPIKECSNLNPKNTIINDQEVADQFGTLNIKSPNHKSLTQISSMTPTNMMIKKNNETEQNMFLENQSSQNCIQNGKLYSGNSSGFPIHQQQ